MIKMMKELKRHEIMRRIEWQDAEKQQFAPDQAIPNPINDNRDEAATQSLRDEAATRKAEKKGDLKKQSQYAPELIGTTSFIKRDYENKPANEVEENKAKQACPEPVEWSQFPASEQTKKAGKNEKSLAVATG